MVCQLFGLTTTGMVCQWFIIKTTAMISLGLASKSVASGFLVGPQNQQLWFDDLCLKIIATIFWFGPQNQAGYDLSVAPQNRREDEDSVRHASRSSGLLHVEASRARVFQSGLKTGGGAARMVQVAWRSS
jgi:hypothetical protein